MALWVADFRHKALWVVDHRTKAIKHTLEFYVPHLLSRPLKHSHQELVLTILLNSAPFDENDIILNNILKQFNNKNPKNVLLSLHLLGKLVKKIKE